jgi:hypothetical protein
MSILEWELFAEGRGRGRENENENDINGLETKRNTSSKKDHRTHSAGGLEVFAGLLLK